MRFPSPLLLTGAAAIFLQTSVLRAEPPAERGRYLVEEVAKCGDCHTPADANGAPDPARNLKGAALPFTPLQALPKWHKTAPDLTPAGKLFQRWGAPGLVKFLTTGRWPNGNAADPPMPAYKLKPQDAEAIVAYLKTLK